MSPFNFSYSYQTMMQLSNGKQEVKNVKNGSLAEMINDENFRFFETSKFHTDKAEAHISFKDIVITIYSNRPPVLPIATSSFQLLKTTLLKNHTPQKTSYSLQQSPPPSPIHSAKRLKSLTLCSITASGAASSCFAQRVLACSFF